MISCRLTSNRGDESTSYKRRIHIQAFVFFQGLGFDEQFAAFIYYMINSFLNISGHLLQTKF